MTRTLSLTKAREELPTLVEKAQKQLNEFVITVRGEPAAVIMSIAEYESWKETMDIMSDPGLMKAIKQGEEDVKKRRVYDWEDVKKELGLDVQSKANRTSKKRT